MIAPRGTEERFIVPRWRSFGRTAGLGELSVQRLHLNHELQPRSDDIEADLQSFQASPGLHSASDLIDRALHGEIPRTAIQKAAEYVIASADAGPALRRSAFSVLRENTDRPAPSERSDDPAACARKSIRRLRTRLRFVPRDPVSWADLALAQTLTGNLERAQLSMRTAISLAPHNRFIIRSASRFFVHIGRPDVALDLVVRGRAGREDPWLMAAEIAVATSIDSGPRPRVRSILHMVNDTNHSKRDVSELLCALATLEFDSGSIKRGRRLVDRALMDPTENAVAQAEFESQRSNFEIPEDALVGPGSDEARALASGSNGDWEPALVASRSWQSDQSFDADPAIYRSYVAAVGNEDFHDALEATRLGLVSNPGNATLCNNRAFAFANLDDTAKARSTLDRISHSVDKPDGIAKTATLGLIAFREGFLSEGRRHYLGAIQDAVDIEAYSQAGLAAAYYSLEESRFSRTQGLLAIESVSKVVGASRNPDALMILDRARTVASSAQFPSRE